MKADNAKRRSPPERQTAFLWQFENLEVLSAGSAAGVAPVLLNHPVVVAERLVVFCRSRCAGGGAQTIGIAGGSGAEVEVAFVGVFRAELPQQKLGHSNDRKELVLSMGSEEAGKTIAV